MDMKIEKEIEEMIKKYSMFEEDIFITDFLKELKEIQKDVKIARA